MSVAVVQSNIDKEVPWQDCQSSSLGKKRKMWVHEVPNETSIT